jgi:hypothetical protein
MASSPPELHMDRLGYRLGARSCDLVLAAEERVGNTNPMVKLHQWSITLAGQLCPATEIFWTSLFGLSRRFERLIANILQRKFARRPR